MGKGAKKEALAEIRNLQGVNKLLENRGYVPRAASAKVETLLSRVSSMLRNHAPFHERLKTLLAHLSSDPAFQKYWTRSIEDNWLKGQKMEAYIQARLLLNDLQWLDAEGAIHPDESDYKERVLEIMTEMQA